MNRTIDEKTSARKIVDPKVVFTTLFVLGLLLLAILRTNGWRLPLPTRIGQTTTSTPEDAVYAMLDAARAGDTNAYLDAFSGPMREQLAQVMKENDAANFAAYLKSQNAAFQGVAVSVTDRASDTEVQVRVEYVYGNRNEIQSVYLRKESARWRIVKIAGAEQIKTLLPFGSAVTD